MVWREYHRLPTGRSRDFSNCCRQSQRSDSLAHLAMRYLLIGILVAGAILLLFSWLTRVSKRRNRLSYSEVADIIERHIDGTEGPWDWDDFTSIPIGDDDLDAIRIRCIDLERVLPGKPVEELRAIVRRLRSPSVN